MAKVGDAFDYKSDSSYFVAKGDKQMDGVKTLTKCTVCKMPFQIDGTNVRKKEFEAEDGNHIWLTYYDCPACGSRHYVQADDVETNGVLIDLTRKMGKIAACKKKGSKISKKQQNDFEGTRQYLADLRRQLMEKYQECDFTAEDGHIEKVVFVQ